MAFARDLTAFAALNCFPNSPSTVPFVSSPSPYFSSKTPIDKATLELAVSENTRWLAQKTFLYFQHFLEIHFSTYSNGEYNIFGTIRKSPHIVSVDHNRSQRHNHCFGVKSGMASTIMNQDADDFLLNAVKMNVLERFALAWKILFPVNTNRRKSNANIAKQRLKMILFADRCVVSDEAKQKIVSNIIKALSDFVEIESQDKVQLSVSTDIDLGTVYSVMVPVRRVKPGYQQSDEEFTGITGIQFKDTGEKSGCVDVKFDFYVPDEKKWQIR